MKRTLIALLMVMIPTFVAAEICRGITPVQHETSKDTGAIKSRKVRLGLMGYLLLRNGYRAYQTKDLRDAWYGYIVSPDDTFRIRYTAGLVQTPFQKGKDKFVWLKRESIYKGMLKYGLLRTNEGGEMAATVGFVNFYAPINTESDMKLFLEIVRSYRVEQCQGCERALPKPPSNKALQLTAR